MLKRKCESDVTEYNISVSEIYKDLLDRLRMAHAKEITNSYNRNKGLNIFSVRDNKGFLQISKDDNFLYVDYCSFNGKFLNWKLSSEREYFRMMNSLTGLMYNY